MQQAKQGLNNTCRQRLEESRSTRRLLPFPRPAVGNGVDLLLQRPNRKYSDGVTNVQCTAPSALRMQPDMHLSDLGSWISWNTVRTDPCVVMTLLVASPACLYRAVRVVVPSLHLGALHSVYVIPCVDLILRFHVLCPPSITLSLNNPHDITGSYP